ETVPRLAAPPAPAVPAAALPPRPPEASADAVTPCVPVPVRLIAAVAEPPVLLPWPEPPVPPWALLVPLREPVPGLLAASEELALPAVPTKLALLLPPAPPVAF